MKKRLFVYCLIVVFIILFSSQSFAKDKIIDTMFKVLKTYETINKLEFSWKVDIYTDKEKQCFLIIRFYDSDKFEIDSIHELINVTRGRHLITGREYMDLDKWESVQDTETTLKCH